MDPHSRRSQFNHRAPKAGPQSRNLEPAMPKHQESNKMPSNRKSSTSKSSSAAAAATNFLIRRPIATNSRVKQDEMFKRDMYLSFVANALQQKANGITDSFDELVAQFNLFSSSSSSTTSKRPSTQQQQPQVDTAQIRLWLVALSHVVSRLERTHATLVDAIVNMPWMTLESATVKSYTVFIGMLLSARPEYLSLVLAKIALGFTYQSGIQALDASMPSTSSTPLTRRVIYDRLHYLLRHVLSLIPTLPSTLQPLLVRHFPHKRQNQLAQTTYIRNLLRVSSYCPELADKILATIVDRAIQIDVEIQIELEELEEEEENIEDHDVFELDPFDVVLGAEPGSSIGHSDSESDDDGDEDTFSDLSSEAGDLDDLDPQRNIDVPTNVRHIQEMVKKLDAILMLLFEHFERTRIVSTGTRKEEEKSVDSRQMSPFELPPLPPFELGSSGLSRPLTPFESLGPPYTQLTDSILQPQPQPTFTTNTKEDNEPTDKTSLRSQFLSLLSIFDRTILRTFKSRYTQFLVFWYASLDPEFADVFQGMLVDRALMPGSASASIFSPPRQPNGDATDSAAANNNAHAHTLAPELTRAAAASYIGSFVSRAKFVDREGARRVVGVLCEYLRAHLEGVEEALRLGFGSRSNSSAAVAAILSSGQHTVFYAVAQAVFLIFCFRWRDLALDEDADELGVADELDLTSGQRVGKRSVDHAGKDKWMPELAVLKMAVVSVLNPLKVCSSNVVMQFARVAQATDFIYCYTILDANKRFEITASPCRGGSSDAASTSTTMLNPTVLYESANAELNTFFPFDPYRLPKSNVFIQGVYREWSSVAIDDEEGNSDEEEEEDDDDDEADLGSGAIRADASRRGALGGYLDIPGGKARDSEDDGGLGESLIAMSISPARMSISVSMHA